MKCHDVLLVSMPWAKLSEPSLGLSILTSCLRDNGVNCSAKYFNIELLRYLTHQTYKEVSDINALNEFLFTNSFEENISPKQLDTLFTAASKLCDSRHNPLATYFDTPPEYVEFFLKIRNEIIPNYLQECLEYILERKPTLVGFTCMYDQTFSSIALADLLKKEAPDIKTIFGGYALEGSAGLELIRHFDCIDMVAMGDGERVMVDVAMKKPPEEVCNLIYRYEGAIRKNPRIKINMEESPDPDYSDFHQDIAELEKQHKVKIFSKVLPIETSRGCWWGQKNHCTFCGIDEDTLKYRHKSTAKSYDMISKINSEHPDSVLRIVDYILPIKYFDTLLPKLAKYPDELQLTCEIKSNMTSEKFELLRNAGFIEVQPGIESFSTSVLRKMSKGVSGIQNILTLKLGRLNGIKIDWNLLYGFHDDVAGEYYELVRIIPQLYHLDPPFNNSNVFVTKFSPMESSHSSFGLSKPVPHNIYDILFSSELLDEKKIRLENVCYFFESQWKNCEELQNLYKILDAQVSYWKENQIRGHSNKTLSIRCEEGKLIFDDQRISQDQSKKHVFPQWYADVYNTIHTRISTRRTIFQKLRDKRSHREIEVALQDMLEARVVFQEGEKLLGLAI